MAMKADSTLYLRSASLLYISFLMVLRAFMHFVLPLLTLGVQSALKWKIILPER